MEERVYSAYTFVSLFFTKGSQDRNSHRAGTWRQELMQRTWRGAAYWLASPGLLSLLSYRTQDYQPRMVPPTMGWALPHQSLIKKMPYSLILWSTLVSDSTGCSPLTVYHWMFDLVTKDVWLGLCLQYLVTPFLFLSYSFYFRKFLEKWVFI